MDRPVFVDWEMQEYNNIFTFVDGLRMLLKSVSRWVDILVFTYFPVQIQSYIIICICIRLELAQRIQGWITLSFHQSVIVSAFTVCAVTKDASLADFGE